MAAVGREVEVERVVGPTDEVRRLIAALDGELSAQYAPEQRHGLSVDAIFQPGVLFFVARLDGAAVGCGGIAVDSGGAEVKRMYVRPEFRGRPRPAGAGAGDAGAGVAEVILARLEREAAASGAGWLRLETGVHQHAAIRFYERCGFRRCGPFGAYCSLPPASIATSVFMEKPIG